MRCSRVLMIVLAWAFLSGMMVASAQEEDDALTPSRLQTLSETQVDELIQRAIKERVPPKLTGALTILLLNREGLVLPKILDRLREALADPAKPGEVVVGLEELLAYVASPASLDALLSLETDYAPRVERLLPMVLSHAVGRRNPFELAYRVMDRGSDGSRQAVVRWVDERSTNERYYAEWATAFLRRNGGRVSDSVLAVDPFVSRMGAGAQLAFRAAIEREVRRGAERREK